MSLRTHCSEDLQKTFRIKRLRLLQVVRTGSSRRLHCERFRGPRASKGYGPRHGTSRGGLRALHRPTEGASRRIFKSSNASPTPSRLEDPGPPLGRGPVKTPLSPTARLSSPSTSCLRACKPCSAWTFSSS